MKREKWGRGCGEKLVVLGQGEKHSPSPLPSPSPHYLLIRVDRGLRGLWPLQCSTSEFFFRANVKFTWSKKQISFKNIGFEFLHGLFWVWKLVLYMESCSYSKRFSNWVFFQWLVSSILRKMKPCSRRRKEIGTRKCPPFLSYIELLSFSPRKMLIYLSENVGRKLGAACGEKSVGGRLASFGIR